MFESCSSWSPPLTLIIEFIAFKFCLEKFQSFRIPELKSIYFCLPLLCYCIGSLEFTSGQNKDLAVCWNDCFRRIFGFKRYESVKLLQFYCKELPFEYIVELYKWKFLTSRVYVSDRFIFFYDTTYMWLMSFIINMLYLDRHCHHHIWNAL